MPTPLLCENLGDWQNAPIIQNEVIAYMDSIGAPMLLREIYRPLQLPRYTVNRVLGRLHAKGFVTRYRAPMRTHRWDRATGTLLRGGATLLCYLYALTEGSGL